MIKVEHTTADGRTVRVVVHEAEVRHNLHRARLMRQAVQATGEGESDVLNDILKFNTYPACVAVSTDYEDSKYKDRTAEHMTYDEFLEVPDQFLTKWAEATFKLNPEWVASSLVPPKTPSGRQGRTKST